jgi:hypothetical protein
VDVPALRLQRDDAALEVMKMRKMRKGSVVYLAITNDVLAPGLAAGDAVRTRLAKSTGARPSSAHRKAK